jgi:predicted ATPase with chaperone activity
MELTTMDWEPQVATIDPPATARGEVPRPPESLEEAGLSEELVGGLVLKALYARGTALGLDLFDILALPMSVLDDVIQQLQEQRLVEVHATKGPRRGEWVFRLTGAGRKRAAEELETCRYVGPAPVPFDDFRRWVERQSVEHTRVAAEELRDALDGIVVPDSMVDLLGPAINSGRSLFLFGDPGNGKTLLSERISRVFGQRYFVPYAVLVDGSVMIVHDPVHHRSGASDTPDPDAPTHVAEGPAGIIRSLPEHDRRYAEARRPVVITGGELTLEQLDLQWDPAGRMYQAPPQLKAAGGVLVVDDLGRQRVPVRDLLNRWVVPLERREDYLTLGSGKKVVVPFDCFVIFSTNLQPKELADEAFLRRIHYKIEVPDPDRSEYERIFRACCAERGIPFEEDALDYLFGEFYETGKVIPRRCQPRDVLDHLRDLAEYRGEPASLSRELLDQACRSYFLPLT